MKSRVFMRYIPSNYLLGEPYLIKGYVSAPIGSSSIRVI